MQIFESSSRRRDCIWTDRHLISFNYKGKPQCSTVRGMHGMNVEKCTRLDCNSDDRKIKIKELTKG